MADKSDERLSNVEFFEALAGFYDNTREAGSVWITIKRGEWVSEWLSGVEVLVIDYFLYMFVLFCDSSFREVCRWGRSEWATTILEYDTSEDRQEAHTS